MEKISQRTNIFRVWITIATFPVFDCCNMYSKPLRKVSLRDTVLFAQLTQPGTKGRFIGHLFHPRLYNKIVFEECPEPIRLHY